MTLKDTCKHLKNLLEEVTSDLDKAEKGNKAASQRVRTGTIKLEKIAKLYRRESVHSEKTGSGKKKKTGAAAAPSKKPEAVSKGKKAAKKGSVGKKPALKPTKAKHAVRAKPAPKSASKEKPAKRATAKLPKKKSGNK